MTDTNTWNADERAAAGMARMDDRDPGWEPSIDLDRLKLWDGGRCILGQRYGSYLNGITDLDMDEPTAQALGFVVAVHPELRAEYAALTAAWRSAIAARRAAVVPELVPV